MAKTNNAVEADDVKDGGDAPLLDLNDASVKKLIARAKKRGYVTYDELNDALPQDQMSSEQIEDIMAALNDMGVQVVENEEQDEDEEGGERAAEPEIDTSGDELGGDGSGDGERYIVEKKKETVDRTDDPVRMYLREMGAVELLSREGEIAIAKRIEPGRDTMIWGLCESPITFNAIIEWSNALNEGRMQLREILDLEAMLSKGPTPEQVASAEDIDKAMVLGYNHPMGPLRLTDLVGLDIRLSIAEYLFEKLGSEVFRPPDILRRKVAEGKLGKKSGEGFYKWEGARD